MPKISALPPNVAPDGDDELPGVDDSTGSTIKWTLTTIKGWLQGLAGWITSAMVADDAIGAPKIDFGGEGEGVWWEEIGRTTLTVAGDTITVDSLPAKKYLRLYIYNIPTGGTIGGGQIRFNNDSGNNYAVQRVNIEGTVVSATSATSANHMALVSATSATHKFYVVDIINVANKEKTALANESDSNSAGAGNPPLMRLTTGKWANTSEQITRIDCLNLSGSGDFAIGSELIVLGHD